MASSTTATKNASHDHRIMMIHNTSYIPDGTKSLGHVIRKYAIMPTLETPFLILDELTSPEKDVLELFGLRRKGYAHGHQKHRRMMKVHRQDSEGTVGEVQAEDVQNDSEYICPVQIGEPAQEFRLDFDTGSADLWVWSTELPKKLIAHTNHAVFDPSKSRTFNMVSGETWNITYGDGSSASGNVGTDVVRIGGIRIDSQAVELANKMSKQFYDDVSDGLLGLAFSSINTVQPVQARTAVENMVVQNDIPQSAELFTAYLSSSKNPDEPCFYTFGVIDKEVCDEQDIHYTPIDNSHGFWQFPSQAYSVNGVTVSRYGNTAIADTGTTLALVDDQTCRHIYAKVPGAKYSRKLGGYIFPSNTAVSALPIVSFDVGGCMFSLKPEDLAFANAGDNMTFGGVQSRGDLPFDILGDTFLKSIYAIFDVGGTRFGAVQRVSSRQRTDVKRTAPGQVAGTATASDTAAGYSPPATKAASR